MARIVFHLRLMQEWKRENQNKNAQKMTLNCGPRAKETSVEMAHTVFHLRLMQEWKRENQNKKRTENDFKLWPRRE